MNTPAHVSPFDQIKKTTEEGNEYWSSRDLSKVLGYDQYRNFEAVIRKAKIACEQSGQEVADHFADVSNMITVGKGAQREVKNILMSRYACYLVIQNADPQKELVALGQTYFAVQARRQELSDHDNYIEDGRRLLLREELREHNKKLADTAKLAGVVEPMDYAIFTNHGYRGLYNGLDQRGIHERKGLKKSQHILDHMGSAELAANLFRATQAEEKLKRDGVSDKNQANKVHFTVGAKVRKTIKDLGGTMPEDLPPVESIKKLEARRARGELNSPPLNELLEPNVPEDSEEQG